IAPPPPPAAQQSTPQSHDFTVSEYDEEKPKVQPREVAEKAIKEIKNVPPRLMVYSIAGAAVVILIIAVVLVLHINHLNSDDDLAHSSAASSASQAADTQ